MNLLEAQEVTKKFSGHTALDNVSIDVPAGSIFGLLGPNGAGKTTLIRIINMITAPDEGSLLFQGKRMKRSDIMDIGYLPEERGLYKKMKVGEQALYLAQLKGLPRFEAQKRLKEWFDKFDIGGWWNKKVEELSKGMQQKVQFIVTVIHKPRLLIFDEPFSGFDPINVNLLKQEILKLRDEGATIIFSTHNMESVEELCSEIALINKSKTILKGDVVSIKKQYKTDNYLVEYSGNEDLKPFLPDEFSILERKSSNGHNTALIKAGPGVAANEMLRSIMPHVHVHSFEEKLPTMNDIFISKVKEDG
jgi:ABC-2 type transport system ATP-binding protein